MLRSAQQILMSLRQNLDSSEKIMNPEIWLDASQEMNLVIGAEQAKLFDLQQKIAQMENEEYQKTGKMTAAKNLVRATDEYKEMKRQEAFCKNCEEFGRIAKLRARQSSGNFT